MGLRATLHQPARPSWDVCSHRPDGMRRVTPSAIPTPPPTRGAIESAEEFGKRIYLEACRRGWSRAQKKVVLGDGAEWIWRLAALHFFGAIQIVDLYHARQHLWELVRALHPNDHANQKRWMMVQQNRLDNGRIEKLVSSLRSISSSNPELRKTQPG
jgi:hypothetical protein